MLYLVVFDISYVNKLICIFTLRDGLKFLSSTSLRAWMFPVLVANCIPINEGHRYSYLYPQHTDHFPPHCLVPLEDISIIIFDVSRTHTIGYILGTTPLDKWLARRKDHYLHNTPKKRTFLLTHWHTQTPVRCSEPSMSFLLILAFC